VKKPGALWTMVVDRRNLKETLVRSFRFLLN
jgi:hypothetical protein